MKLPLFILSILCNHCIVHAQPRPLNIGDTMPSAILQSIQAQAPNHHGYWIIDFMASWCTSCIKALPHHTALQKEQNGKVQFVLITKEPTQKFTTFWQNNKLTQQLSFPVITADTLLGSLFPHISLSHIAWLSPQGVVMAITGTGQVTTSAIQDFTKGKNLRLPVKNDFLRYDYKQPVFAINSLAVPEYSQPQQSAYSVFTSYMPGLQNSSRAYPDSSNQQLRICCLNLSIPQLYRFAFDLKKNKNLQIVLQVADSNRFVYNDSLGTLAEWNSINTFCYEAMFPFTITAAQRTKKILADLDFYTGCSATFTQSATGPVLTIIQNKPQL